MKKYFKGNYTIFNLIFGVLLIILVFAVIYTGVKAYRKDMKVFGANKPNDTDSTIGVDIIKSNDYDLTDVFPLEQMDAEQEQIQENEQEAEIELVVDEKSTVPYFFTSEIYKYIKEETDLFDLTKSTLAIESGAYVPEEYVDLHYMTDYNFVTESTPEPKILIFHTHEYEKYSDSRSRTEEDSVVGVGAVLADALTGYGWSVMHDKTKYDVLDGEVNTNVAYAQMEEGVSAILEQNPSIEVLIDIHRDGFDEGLKIVADTFDKPTAKIMFVTGATCLIEKGVVKPLEEFPNPFVKENIAFALQMQLLMSEQYPGLCRKMLIKPYRYSLHMKPKSLLIEVGANTNTMEEAHNTIKPIAEILNKVLSAEN